MIGTTVVDAGQGNTTAELIRIVGSCGLEHGFKSLVLNRLQRKSMSFKTKLLLTSTLDVHDLARISAALEDAPSNSGNV